MVVIQEFNLILFNVDIQLLKRLLCPPLNCLGSSVEHQLSINVRIYFCTLNSIPLIYISILTSVPHCLDYCSFLEICKIRKFEYSNCVLFFKIVLAILSSLHFHMNPKINLSIFATKKKKIQLEFNRYVSNLQFNLGVLSSDP